LFLSRDYLRIESPTVAALNFQIFKPEFKQVERKFDKQATSFAEYEGKGDVSGRRADRKVRIYSRNALFRVAGKDRESFCKQEGNLPLRCDADSQNILELIRGWQTPFR
jgi:hypothetical protein